MPNVRFDQDMSDARPAIRWINYMGDSEAMAAVNLIGPYADVAARNRDLRRLENLPLGATEYNGGREFTTATMSEAAERYAVQPERVANVTTQRGFHAAFFGYREETDEDETVCLHAGDGEHDCDDPTAEATCRFDQGGDPPMNAIDVYGAQPPAAQS